jgi:carbon monoxide dehydrogenase subunit G
MKKTVVLVPLLALTLPTLCLAHGPSRQKVEESIEIQAAPDAVWNVIKDFGNAQAWMPQIANTVGHGSNDKGATRELTLKSGGVIKEELKSYDAAQWTFSYKITEVDPSVLPVANYSSTIKVEAAGGGSKVEWSGAFYRSWMTNNPPPEQNDQTAIAAVTKIYQDGLANLKSVVEKK